jgi:uncharacterized membrane protein
MADEYKFRYDESLAGSAGREPAPRQSPAPSGPATNGHTPSRAKFLGHAVHQQLIPFPLGLLGTAVIFDILYLVTDRGKLADVAYWMIAAGIIGGLVAAPFGLADWTGIRKGTRAKRIGALHGLGNLVLVVLFAVSWLLRRPEPAAPDGVAFVFSFVGFGLALVSGWLGGELIDRLAVGIDSGAHADSPPSLSRRPAHELSSSPSRAGS